MHACEQFALIQYDLIVDRFLSFPVKSPPCSFIRTFTHALLHSYEQSQLIIHSAFACMMSVVLYDIAMLRFFSLSLSLSL